MTCKDCFHYKVCKSTLYDFEADNPNLVIEKCPDFINKYDIVTPAIPCNFTAENLETGMHVEFEDGTVGLVFDGKIYHKRGNATISCWDSNLNAKEVFGIKSISRVFKPICSLGDIYSTLPEGLVWERNPTKKRLSLTDVKKLLRCNVEITDAAPKGIWKNSPVSNEEYVCSVCGGGAWYYDYRGTVSKSFFCPNCGADMREEQSK